MYFKSIDINPSDELKKCTQKENNQELICGDCLCRVCANNAGGCGTECSGCNSCTGVVATEKDCVNGMFKFDEDVDEEILTEIETSKPSKVISAVTIAKLIEAHQEGDEEKFLSYAKFIAEAYKDAGQERSAKIIQQRIDGTYKTNPKVVLD